MVIKIISQRKLVMKPFSTLIASPAFKARLMLYFLQITACDLPVVEPVNPNPSSNFAYTIENDSCAANCNVAFTNQSQNAEAYEWNFGDGTPVSNALNPVHTYAVPGTYNVSLKAMNDVAEDDTTVTVVLESSGAPVQPTACFTISNNNCTAPCTVTFTNCSTDGIAYEWNFGDGSAVVTTDSASHLFSSEGSYEVKLTVTNESGSANIKDTVTIAERTAARVAIALTANAANTSNHMTRIDHEVTDHNANKVLVVTPVFGVVNDAALGAYYYSNQWYIFNQNLNAIKDGEKFNVYVADPEDAHAFVHRTSPANIREGYISTIDHPATNNNPIARIFVTPVWEKASDYNEHPVGVAYINNRWEIFNLDRAALPEDLRFNVIVSTDDQKSFVHSTRFIPFFPIVQEYSVIDDPRTNGRSELKIFATMNQGTSISTVINPRVTGVWYRESQGKWTVYNKNASPMTQGARYNIMAIE